MRRREPVAVLGAGIMGCSLALNLARRGVQVTLFDAEAGPCRAASRWNEGKIHLGYLYSADPTLHTADKILTGGLLFRPLMEELLDCSLEPVITQQDDIYLCHRDSVVSVEATQDYLQAVSSKLRAHPDAASYLADATAATVSRLSDEALAGLTDSAEIVAGFRVPERSVETSWIAERLAAAVHADPRITCRMNTRVDGVYSIQRSSSECWKVRTPSADEGPFAMVINALWQGRLAIDQSAGLAPPARWSHRFRQSLYLRSRVPLETPCAIIVTGPFGDVKNYNGRDFYLSWYPAGLRADSSELQPPHSSDLELPDSSQLARTILDRLESLLPWVGTIRDNIESQHIEGGWVYAAGSGPLADRASTLHQRSSYGVERTGTYLSIDTGKYSTAPHSARQLVDALFP